MAPPGLKAITAATLLALAPLASALGQKQIVAFEPSDGALQVAGGDIGAGQIRVSKDEFWGVVRAAGDLAVDFGRVTGTNYSLSNGVGGAEAIEYKFEPADVSDNTVVSSFIWVLSLCLEEGGRLFLRRLGKMVLTLSAFARGGICAGGCPLIRSKWMNRLPLSHNQFSHSTPPASTSLGQRRLTLSVPYHGGRVVPRPQLLRPRCRQDCRHRRHHRLLVPHRRPHLRQQAQRLGH